MSRWIDWLCSMLVLAVFAPCAAAENPPWHRFGRTATTAEIAAWDIDVRPDGTGLPPGRGTVAQGRDLYDTQCASCHGEFGDSNQYMQIAGGVGTLASQAPVRSTGSKLQHATTLWDYLRRAMPFQAPKSLTLDQVYALTAYVLHLNDLLPEDAVLDREALLRFRPPNYAAFTEAHGMKHPAGRSDTGNTRCMQGCEVSPVITSSLPDHARNAHGDLSAQVRPVGPYRGADTTRSAPEGPLAASVAARAKGAPASAGSPGSGPVLARRYACGTCHDAEHRSVGPSFRDIARRYAGNQGAGALLVGKVRSGGSGVWGSVPMPAQPQVGEADLGSIIDWILSGAP